MSKLFCSSIEELKENWEFLSETNWFKNSDTVLKEWNFATNKKVNLLSLNEKTKYWFKCQECGSDYDKAFGSIRHLVQKSGREAKLCNYCVGYGTNHTNAVFTTHPDLKVYWSKNNKVHYDTVRATTKKKVLWECLTCHTEFESPVIQFVSASKNKYKGCPYCAGKRVNHTNSVASLYPELLKEWDEDNNEYSLDEVTVSSDKRINWKCSKNHTWSTMVKDRIKSSKKEAKLTQCPYCVNYKVLKGYNDLATLHPELVKNVVHEEDLYKWNSGSANKIEWKCDECDTNLGLKSIKNVVVHGLSCVICSKKASNPERFMSAILKDLGIYFDHNQGFSWSQQKAYDFYLKDYNAIIETHGEQHYISSGSSIFHKTRSLSAEKENDILKRQLAKSNDIQYYIEIPCIKTSFEELKKSVEQSTELKKLIPLNQVDWDNVYELWKF